MDIHTARLVREIKKGCTFRRLAEIYYLEGTPEYGDQYAGQHLCHQACKILGIDMRREFFPEEDTKFKDENTSLFGDFYWWN